MNSSEYIDFDAFKSTGVAGDETFNVWRKKTNGIIAQLDETNLNLSTLATTSTISGFSIEFGTGISPAAGSTINITGGTINVNYDNSTIGINSSNQLFVKDLSITPAKLSTGRPSWDSTGKVGIGKAVGTKALEVNGDVSAAAFVGALTGNADTATKLAAPKTINTVAFDGSSNITLTANTTNSLSAGAGLVGTVFNGSTAQTWTVDSDITAAASKIALRGTDGTLIAATPTASTHLTTKAYVDGKTSTINGVLKFPEKTNGGRHNPYYSLFFVDADNVLRVIGAVVGRASDVDVPAPAAMFGSNNALYNVNKIFVNDKYVFVLSNEGNLFVSGTEQGNYLNRIATLPAIKKVVISNDTSTATNYFLTTTGSVYSVGTNTNGQIGNNSTAVAVNPILTLGPGNTYGNPTSVVVDIQNVGNSANHSAIALLSDNTVWCVGYGGQGQMGNNVAVEAVNSVWKQVKISTGANLTGITAIYGDGRNGDTSFRALSTNGTLYSWGDNTWGQLGIGSNAIANYATVTSTNVVKFWSFGAACFIKKTDGRIYSYGYNDYGALGLGNTAAATSPTLVTALSTHNIENLWGSADNTYPGMHVFAKATGSNAIFSVGHNEEGQLGNGTSVGNSLTFSQVYFPITSPIIDMHCLFNLHVGGYTFILTADGEVYHTGVSKYGWGTVTNNFHTLLSKVTNLICG